MVGNTQKSYLSRCPTRALVLALSIAIGEASSDCSTGDLADTPDRPNPDTCLNFAAGYLFLDVFRFVEGHYSVGTCSSGPSTTTKGECLHDTNGTCSDGTVGTESSCPTGSCSIPSLLSMDACLENAGVCSDSTSLTASACYQNNSHWLSTNTWTASTTVHWKPNENISRTWASHSALGQCAQYDDSSAPAVASLTTGAVVYSDNFCSGTFSSDMIHAYFTTSQGQNCQCKTSSGSSGQAVTFGGSKAAAKECTDKGFTWSCAIPDSSPAENKQILETMLCIQGHDAYGDGIKFQDLLQDYAKDTAKLTVVDIEKAIKSTPFHAGWFILLIVLEVYLFCGIAIVCDDFFTPALEKLAIVFDLSEDVAGATFMAAGSSAPELFTSLAAVMFPDPCSNRSSVGIGTIVGSAIFNILIIIGATAMLTTEILQLNWRPLVRDSCWYAFSILILVIFVVGDEQTDKITGNTTGYVEWWEGLVMTLCYGLYILFMKYNERIMGTGNKVIDEPVKERIRRNSVVDKLDMDDGIDTEAGETTTTLAEDEKTGAESDDEDDGDPDCLGVDKPEGALDKCVVYFSYFWYLAFMWTIPDCSKGAKRENWYVLSFVNSIIWIGVICIGMVEAAIILGELLNISATVMGLTVLSAGTSVPDAISSIVVAQRGMGDMAVSNALGSNVFDILLGLGFPYFLAAITQEADKADPLADMAVKMCIEDVSVYIICLAAVLVAVIGTFAVFKFQLHPRLGYILVAMYVLFAVFAILRDTEVIDTGASCDAGH